MAQTARFFQYKVKYLQLDKLDALQSANINLINKLKSLFLSPLFHDKNDDTVFLQPSLVIVIVKMQLTSTLDHVASHMNSKYMPMSGSFYLGSLYFLRGLMLYHHQAHVAC